MSGNRGVKDLISGGVAGACEILVTFPLDTVKTQMQLNPTKYTGIGHAVTTIVQANGVKGLYFGMPAMLVQVSAKAAIRFATFEQYKIMFKKMSPDTPQMGINFVSGLLAGFTEAVAWTTPTERLKVLRQNEITSGGQKYSSLVRGMLTVVREQGLPGLYKGVVATGIRQASSVGVRFMLYNEVKNLISDPKDSKPYHSMIAGGTVGAISVVVNNPVDVVKSRIQAQGSGTDLKYTGTVQAFTKIAREEGFKSFFRGVSARVLRVGLGQAVTFATYEQIVKLIESVM